MKPMLAIEDVEKLLNISDRTVRRLISDGSLKAYQIGGQLRFIEDEVFEFIQSSQVKNISKSISETTVTLSEDIHAWIFQAKPENMQPIIDEMKPGARSSFTVRKYGNQIHGEHQMLIWLSGKESGIYVVCKLIGEVYDRPPEHLFGPQGIDYEVEKVLQSPIYRRDLLLDPILKDLQIIRQKIGTNFPITDREWNAIEKLIQ